MHSSLLSAGFPFVIRSVHSDGFYIILLCMSLYWMLFHIHKYFHF